MAISGPTEGPSILKVQSEPIKRWILHKFGHPHVRVELNDAQLEDIIRVAGDFIAMYFPREQKVATFYTTPLQPTYPLPSDAWMVEEVNWDPYSNNHGDVFSADYHLLNSGFGGVGGGGNDMVLNMHLLSHFRKHSQKILGVEGRWEVMGEGDGPQRGDMLSAENQRIRLIPTPKASYPVAVVYLPCVTNFRTPQARKITYDLIEAEAKMALGMARRKIQGTPTPDGSAITYDGEALVREGMEQKDKIIELAISLGEPLGIVAT